MSDAAFWDARYAGESYAFGTAPADFLARQAGRLAPGTTALCLADGEGRNAVFLAERGLKVTAMDLSPRGVAKARALAAARGVEVAFREADIMDWPWDAAAYDAIVGIFVQFLAPRDRATVFAGAARAVAPGGLLLLHGYAPRQIGYGTGGPGAVENLYTLDLLHQAYAGWDVLEAHDYDATLAEGRHHVGASALIDFVARKPAI